MLVTVQTSNANWVFDIEYNVRAKGGASGSLQTGVIQLSDFYRVLAICWWWLKQNKAQMDLSPLFFFFLNSSKLQWWSGCFHLGGVYFYSEWLLVCNYSQLIFKLLKAINNAMSFSLRTSSVLGKTSSLCNAFWNALCCLLGHRSLNFFPHTYITWWMGFTTASLLCRETPELAKTNYHQ